MPNLPNHRQALAAHAAIKLALEGIAASSSSASSTGPGVGESATGSQLSKEGGIHLPSLRSALLGARGSDDGDSHSSQSKRGRLSGDAGAGGSDGLAPSDDMDPLEAIGGVPTAN